MKIVHFSISPLAGAPINTVLALRRNTTDDVRLIDLHRWGKFEHDVVFNEDLETAVELTNNADVIHFHNYLTLDSQEFLPINFRDLQKKGKKIIIQYHSAPDLISKTTGTSINDITSPEIPSLVIAQFQERFYPNSKVIPNFISSMVYDIKPSDEQIKKDGIFYSPTNKLPAFSKKFYEHVRWNTKGYYEVIDILKKMHKKQGVEFTVCRKKPFQDTLIEKWNNSIVIDDLITGSYHLTGLEGLAMAKMVLAYMDKRTESVLKEISGSDVNPFINIRLEDLYTTLSYLIENKDKCLIIGEESGRWIKQYWNEKDMAQKYMDVYNDLMTDPFHIKKQDALNINSNERQFFYIDMPNVIHKSRNENYLNNMPVSNKLKNWIINKLDKKRFGVAKLKKSKAK